jgi:hypothetical protein
MCGAMVLARRRCGRQPTGGGAGRREGDEVGGGREWLTRGGG